MYSIRSIYEDNGKWHSYDATFRSLKAQEGP
jgi:hypothetical protein